MKISIICIATLCGRIEPLGIGSALDRARLLEARDTTDASLLGGESLRKSDPEMRCSDGTIPKGRIRALISASGELPTNRRLFKHGPKPLIFTSHEGYERLAQRLLPGSAEPVILPRSETGMLSLAHAVSFLEKRGVRKMLIEGGGRLNYSALQEGIVDELLITLAPKITGNTNMSMLVAGNDHLGRPFLNLELEECRQVPDTHELFLTYRVRKNQQR